MKILFAGNVCNYAYWFAKWSRDLGVDAEALIELDDWYQPELDDPTFNPATPPSWVHYYRPATVNRVIYDGGVHERVRQLSMDVDSVHTFSNTAAIMMQAMGIPFVHHNVGSFGRSVSWVRHQSPRALVGPRRIAMTARFRRAMDEASSIISSVPVDYLEVAASNYRSKQLTLAFPYDIDAIAEYRAAAKRESEKSLTSITTFLMPARQDWFLKGQDLVLKAFARIGAQHRNNIRIVAMEWGRDIEKTKRLAEQLSLTANIQWIPFQNRIGLCRYIGAPRTVVIAEFYRTAQGGGHGGVSRDAMAMATPLISHTRAEADILIHRTPAPIWHSECDEEGIAHWICVAVDCTTQELGGHGDALLQWLSQESHPKQLMPKYLAVHQAQLR
jgi:glycosyltransferase involved in cell wall biosynthesis